MRLRIRPPHAGGLLATVALLAAPPAAAQVSMNVAPVRVEHAVAPGQIHTDVITVENVAVRPLRARVSVADWQLERDGTPTFVKRGRLPAFSMSEWVEVGPTEFEIPPGGTQTIRYTVDVPPGVADASYRTAILIESLPDFVGVPAANAAYLTARIGVIVYNRVGTLTPALEIVKQEIVHDAAAPGGMAIRIGLRNPGLTHVRASGHSSIVDLDGRVLQSLPVRDAVVLPQSEREISLPLEQPVDRPAFSVLSQIDGGLPQLLEVETRVGQQRAEP